MEYRETARMRKYGESKTTGIMMATVPHVTSGLGLRKFQAVGFLLTRVYKGVFTDVCYLFPDTQNHNTAALLLYTGIKEQKYVVFIEYFIQY